MSRNTRSVRVLDLTSSMGRLARKCRVRLGKEITSLREVEESYCVYAVASERWAYTVGGPGRSVGKTSNGEVCKFLPPVEAVGKKSIDW